MSIKRLTIFLYTIKKLCLLHIIFLTNLMQEMTPQNFEKNKILKTDINNYYVDKNVEIVDKLSTYLQKLTRNSILMS